jgi:hypothetical protein
MTSEAFQQFDLLLLPSGPAGKPDQPEHRGARPQHHGITRPGPRMLFRRRDGRVAPPREHEAVESQKPSFPLRQTRGDRVGRRHRRARDRHVAADLIRPCLAGMRQSETRIGHNGALERRLGTRIAGQDQVAALDIVVPRRRPRRGNAKPVTIRRHRHSLSRVRLHYASDRRPGQPPRGPLVFPPTPRNSSRRITRAGPSISSEIPAPDH